MYYETKKKPDYLYNREKRTNPIKKKKIDSPRISSRNPTNDPCPFHIHVDDVVAVDDDYDDDDGDDNWVVI